MAERINDGGTAFPMQDPQAIHAYAAARVEGITDTDERDRVYLAARAQAVGGMTLRDYFAAHVAVPADLTRVWGEMMVRKYPTRPNSNEDAYFGPEVILWWADVEAAYRYIYADAMLRAREGGAA